MVTPDHALRRNVIKVNTDEQKGDVRYRMYNVREKKVVHLTIECSKVAQLVYKKIHDKVSRIVRYSLCEKYGLPRSEQ